MFLKLQVSTTQNNKLLKRKVLGDARHGLLLYKFSAADYALNDYCYGLYKKSLRMLCKEILCHVKVLAAEDHLTVLFATKKYEDLARLITFGDSKIHGSDILLKVFKSR